MVDYPAEFVVETTGEDVGQLGKIYVPNYEENILALILLIV